MKMPFYTVLLSKKKPEWLPALKNVAFMVLISIFQSRRQVDFGPGQQF